MTLTIEEARIIVNLVEVAYWEAQASNEAIEFGRRVALAYGLDFPSWVRDA